MEDGADATNTDMLYHAGLFDFACDLAGEDETIDRKKRLLPNVVRYERILNQRGR